MLRKRTLEYKMDQSIGDWEKFGHTIEKVTGGPVRTPESKDRFDLIDRLSGPLGEIAAALSFLKIRNY